MRLALFEPDIPQNCGTILRLAACLGVAVDIQPAWLYLDTRTLVAQFGTDRLRYFQPLKSIFAAGGASLPAT